MRPYCNLSFFNSNSMNSKKWNKCFVFQLKNVGDKTGSSLVERLWQMTHDLKVLGSIPLMGNHFFYNNMLDGRRITS